MKKLIYIFDAMAVVALVFVFQNCGENHVGVMDENGLESAVEVGQDADGAPVLDGVESEPLTSPGTAVPAGSGNDGEDGADGADGTAGTVTVHVMVINGQSVAVSKCGADAICFGNKRMQFLTPSGNSLGDVNLKRETAGSEIIVVIRSPAQRLARVHIGVSNAGQAVVRAPAGYFPNLCYDHTVNKCRQDTYVDAPTINCAQNINWTGDMGSGSIGTRVTLASCK